MQLPRQSRPAATAAAAALAVAACSAPPPLRPDHGSYVATQATSESVRRFEYPRAKRLVIASPSAPFQCAVEWADRDLRGKAIPVASASFVLDSVFVTTRLTQPATLSASEHTALDGALVLVIAVESLAGPGGHWNPLSSTLNISSAHQRTDISLAIYEPGKTTALWRAQARVREVLKCPDQELQTQLMQLLANIH